MKDKQIEKAVEKLLKMYEEIENDLLVEIASHFTIEEEFQNSDYWRAKKLDEMGLFNQDIIEYLSKVSGRTEKEVQEAFKKIGIDTIDLPTLEKAFKNGKLKINPIIMKDNPVMKAIINRGVSDMGLYFIQLSPKIAEATRKAYLQVVEKTYLQTTTGAVSYNKAIKDALNDLGNKGITTLTYQTTDEDGNVIGVRNYDIESAVRRDVLTNARKTSLEITEEVIKELQPEYLHLSEHLACRPTHFDWQGTIIKTADLELVTGYGEVDGLGGINCRHYFEPHWTDERGNDLKHYTEEECLMQYERTQHQRYLERGIRKWRRKANMFKESGMMEEYSYCINKAEEWTLRNQTYVDMINSVEQERWNGTSEYTLYREYEREQVSNK